MPWNLVGPSSAATFPRRAFYLPLASIPPGRTTVRDVPMDTFTPADDTTMAPDKVFNIRISRPPGGFSDEGTLPDPAYRLHAMDQGNVIFKSATVNGTVINQLILSMDGFCVRPKTNDSQWWERWTDAGCLPYQLIYENVDKAELEVRLNSIEPGQPFQGLTLPPEIEDLDQRADFITEFLAGNDAKLLNAEPGAVIGTAAADPDNAGDRLLKLRGRYWGHNDSSPQFMNPREFFYLLFGDDSTEATTHPLLKQMDAVGKATTGVMETKTIRLRPPLRTYQRVIWESDHELPRPPLSEEQDHASDWKKANSCLGRLYNTHSRQDQSFYVSGYVGSWKCNLFVSDIALRSGFRVCITNVSPTWHYAAAGRYAEEVNRNADNTTARVALNGSIENETKTWGFKLEPFLRSMGADGDDDFAKLAINAAMQVEGRCYILAGSRNQVHNYTGHIMIVVNAIGSPKFSGTLGHGLKSIDVMIREALGEGGASTSTGICEISGTGGAADGHHNFERLHLIELAPGKDPDTETGLRDCNVQI